MYDPTYAAAWASPSGMSDRPSLPSWIAPRPPIGRAGSSSRREPEGEGFAPRPAEAHAAEPPPAPPPAAVESPPPLTEPEHDTDAAPASERYTPPWEVEIASLRVALATVTAQLAHARREVLEASERELVTLAVAVAERIVGRELATDPSLVARWAKEGLDALVGDDAPIVAVAPDVAQRVPAETWAEALGGVPMVVDASLAPGGCEVRGRLSRVDESAASRLTAITAALGRVDE